MEAILGTLYVFLFAANKLKGSHCIGTRASVNGGSEVLESVSHLVDCLDLDFSDGSEVLKLPSSLLHHFLCGDAPRSLVDVHGTVTRNHRGQDGEYLERCNAPKGAKFAQAVIYTRERFLGDAQVRDGFPSIFDEVSADDSIKFVLIDIQATAANTDGLPVTHERWKANRENGQPELYTEDECIAYDRDFVVVAD